MLTTDSKEASFKPHMKLHKVKTKFLNQDLKKWADRMWLNSRNFQINEESEFFVQTRYTLFTDSSMFEPSEVTRL